MINYEGDIIWQGAMKTIVADGTSLYSNALQLEDSLHSGIYTDFPNSWYFINVKGVDTQVNVSRFTKNGDRIQSEVRATSGIRLFLEQNANKTLYDLSRDYLDVQGPTSPSAVVQAIMNNTGTNQMIYQIPRYPMRVDCDRHKISTYEGSHWAPVFGDWEMASQYNDAPNATYFDLRTERTQADTKLKRYAEDSRRNGLYMTWGLWSIYDMPIAVPVLTMLDWLMVVFNISFRGSDDFSAFTHLMYAVLPNEDEINWNASNMFYEGLKRIKVSQFLTDVLPILNLSLIEDEDGNLILQNYAAPSTSRIWQLELNDYTIEAPINYNIRMCDFTKIGLPKDFAVYWGKDQTHNYQLVEKDITLPTTLSCPVMSINERYFRRAKARGGVSDYYENLWALPVFNRGDRIIGFIHHCNPYYNGGYRIDTGYYNVGAGVTTAKTLSTATTPAQGLMQNMYMLSPTDVFDSNQQHDNDWRNISGLANLVWINALQNKYLPVEQEFNYFGANLSVFFPNAYKKYIYGAKITAKVRFPFLQPQKAIGSLFYLGGIKVLCTAVSNFNGNTGEATGTFYKY